MAFTFSLIKCSTSYLQTEQIATNPQFDFI